MLSRNAQIWETNLFNWVLGGSGVFLVLQNSLLFLCGHALFTCGCCCFCVSLRFPCQTFRTSVFVPRSPASNLRTIATSSFWTVLVHEAEFSWFGRFFVQHVLCKQSELIYNPSFLWGKLWKHEKKWASVAYHDSSIKIFFLCFPLNHVWDGIFDISCLMSGHSKFGMVIFWSDDRSF